MNTRTWLPSETIRQFLDLEPLVLILGMAALSAIFYRLFLRKVSNERHKNLRSLFSNVLAYLLLMMIGYAGYTSLYDSQIAPLATPYLGLFTIVVGAISFIKTARIIMLEYLFASHMRAAVPLLLVNIFTLILSVVIGAYIASEVFEVRLAPLLATSAALSLVLGLALQDTLGNLFAGPSLQLDKPYELGDWIELNSGNQTWVGQVTEITWRATILLSMGDETITIPNRLMSQGEISNFSARVRPFIRRISFKFPYGTNVEKTKKLLLDSCKQVGRIKTHPHPLTVIQEMNENWLALRLVYYIDDYANQFIIQDELLVHAMDNLKAAGIDTASPRLKIITT